MFLLFIAFPTWLMLFVGFCACVHAFLKQRKDWYLVLGIVLFMLWFPPVVGFGWVWFQNDQGWTDRRQAEDWLAGHFAVSWNPYIQHFRRYHEPEFDLELVAFEVPEEQVQGFRKHLSQQFKRHEVRNNEVLNCGQKRLAGWWDRLRGQTFDQADLYGDQEERASMMVAYQRSTQLLVFCNWNVYWSE